MSVDERVDPATDPANLATVLSGHPDGPVELTAITPISVGASNRMYRLDTDRGPLVLRIPPRRKVSKSAHDVGREWRLLRALAGTAVPHPRPLLHGDESSPLGGPFLIMELVPGFNLRWDSPALPEAEVRELALRTVDTLAAIGAVDWEAAGLGGFGRPDGFLERQVGRWTSQLEQYRIRPLPGVDELARWLEEHRPARYRTGLMHGDFTFANVLAENGGVTAVVDWEQATIGDPMLDLGWFVGLWAHAGEQPAAVPPGRSWVTQRAGMPTRDEVVERYARASGEDVANLGYYQALALFKLAVVLEGGYAKHVRGDGGNAHQAEFEWIVPQLIDTALDATKGLR
ncbi:aminoglycoside phosphotransferase (APT) family kinase protein [Amycolatopsis bartoniae]|uniref:Putative aminoglycoside phosphotransferase n=1 Tax=Amycolatopsis bartoniae TaxID=941986 RepID=A0A8H9IQ11_9PSEU|nr:phosphotransferase family protein [Amycolatopsis bartoniae]MBB2939664.1 aminoglycoside phosphotransferase (APT) family kinase protein [Amycolatopsis bartoniae]TVT06230.1 phosphotransferase family protein [Amycolatopsis bartoniae]GHF36675.1 putative aminoglycoside phosphotransferase [Amycolatopsis bartoniae]